VLRTFQQVQRPALGVFGLLLAIVVAFLTMKTLKAQSDNARSVALAAERRAEVQSSAMGQLAEASSAPADEPVSYEALSMPVNPLKQRVVATAEAYPDVSAKILRNWMRNV
jgi:flagellar biosynthesis/type III secretory pathway M-ring protein FliF/YscJ